VEILELEIPHERESVTASYRALVYPSAKRRLGAACADGVVTGLFLVLSMYLTLQSIPLLYALLPASLLAPSDRQPLTLLLNVVFNVMLNVGFASALEGSFLQGTPGKILFGLTVVDASGRRITFLHALVRNLSKGLQVLAIALTTLPLSNRVLFLPVPKQRTLAAMPEAETGIMVFGALLFLSSFALIRRRTLYDLISGTKVVRSGKSREVFLP